MRAVVHAFTRVGEATVLAGQILRVLPRPRRYFNAALQQAYVMGIQSLPLVLIMAFLGGAVTSQQTGAQFASGLPLWVIGSVLAASVLTELGPLLTGIVMMARVGASIAAELASMKVTEQIDALIAMGRDPVAFLVVPRVMAGLLVFPPLVILADAMGLLAGWGIGLLVIDGLTSSDVVYGMRFYFRPWVLFFSVLKGGVFGLAITFIACFVGLSGTGGAEGVGRATTNAVVATTLALMIIDVLMVPVLKAF
ncbi:MAG TPA: ABC transporter permease [Longimicrobiales bacterium]|nr:ABC transporter permease [Longimicrobiales bacterium]